MTLTLLDNFYTWARTILLGNTTENGKFSSDTAEDIGLRYCMGTLKTTDGEERNKFYLTTGTASFTHSSSLGYLTKQRDACSVFVKVGSDNNETVLSDYELKGVIDDGIKIYFSISHTDTSYLVIINILNISTEEQNIGEIGLYKGLPFYATTGDLIKPVLLARATLDSVENLAPQSSKTYQLTIAF